MKKHMNKKAFYFSLFVFFAIFTIICTFFVYFSLFKNQTISVYLNSQDDQEITVIIDAGHGGEDGGAIGINGCYEKDLNLSISKKLSEELSTRGIKTILTRDTDTLLYDRNANYNGQKKKLDMKARKEIVDKTENAIFISIHQNTFSVEKYNGFQIYYSINGASSKKLSDKLEESVKKQLQPENTRNAKPSNGIFLLDNVECPAVLLECGFISNQVECENLCNEAYQNQLTSVLADGIEKYISEN